MSDLVLARNCCLARMLPGEAENGVGMNRSAREGPTDWILRCIKTIFTFFFYTAIVNNSRQQAFCSF